ncbi:MAG: PAS domain-containing sensor histidine kinase [Methanoregula sp.]|jgi:PAS domain S-box-containing protein
MNTKVGMKRLKKLSEYFISPTDLIRFIIIASLTLLCIIIITYSISRNLGTIYAQLFYFPIIYATYFYPRRGLYLAGACAVIYECFAYLYIFPDTGGMILVTGQALLFVCISALVAYVSEKINASEVHNRNIVEKSPIGIILFDKNDYTIRLTNTWLEHMLGYTTEDLAGMTFPELFSSQEDRQKFIEFVTSGEEIRAFETVFVTREKVPVWVNLSWNRITENLISCTVIDINKFRLAKMAADKIDAQYRQVTDSLPTCIVIIRDQMIVYTNPPFEVFSGYVPEELLGKDPLILIHPNDQSDFLQSCHLAETGSPHPGRSEVNVIIKSGKIQPATLFFTRILQNGSPSVLINLIDIPEQEGVKGRTQQDNKRQRGLISTFAYELRTPLQPIMGYINLLMQDPETYGVTEETRIILDRCAKSVDRERLIINQMLELSVIDTGKISLEYSVFSIPDMLKNIINAGGYAADADITIDVPADLTFDADKNKISTVIDTMISNAVKYSTHPRKVHISYRSLPNDTMHRLSIRDNGIGITDARLDEIFEPFPIPDSGKTLKFDKVGLSLAIAKKYIKMHEGYISVDSILNLETTFSIHIPKRRPAEVEHNGT